MSLTNSLNYQTYGTIDQTIVCNPLAVDVMVRVLEISASQIYGGIR